MANHLTEVVNEIRSAKNPRQPIPSRDVIEQCELVYSLSILRPALDDDSCPIAGRGQKITQVSLREFLNRGAEWVGNCIDAGELQRRHGPGGSAPRTRIVKYMNGDYSKVMGAASWLEMMKDEVKKEQAEDEADEEASEDGS